MAFTIRILSSDPEETQEMGRVIGEKAQAGDIYLLTGPLGAGKTCLTQGIALGLGVSGYVRSPTFVIMSQYQGRLALYHVDLYRIGSPLEGWDLGLDEQLFGDGVCVVEWADRAAELFPEEALWIALDHGDGETQRTVSFDRRPERYFSVIEYLAASFPVTKEVSP